MRKLEVPFDVEKVVPLEDALAAIHLDWPRYTVSRLPIPMNAESLALFEVSIDEPLEEVSLLLDLSLRKGPYGVVFEADTFVQPYGVDPVPLRDVKGILRSINRQKHWNLPEADFLVATLSQIPKDVEKQALGIEKLLLSEIEGELLSSLKKRVAALFDKEHQFPEDFQDGFQFVTGWLTKREIFASGTFLAQRETNRVHLYGDGEGNVKSVNLPDVTYRMEFNAHTKDVLLCPKVGESLIALFDDNPEIDELAELVAQHLNLNLEFRVSDHDVTFRLQPKPLSQDTFWQLWVLSLLIELEGGELNQEGCEDGWVGSLSGAILQELHDHNS